MVMTKIRRLRSFGPEPLVGAIKQVGGEGGSHSSPGRPHFADPSSPVQCPPLSEVTHPFPRAASDSPWEGKGEFWSQTQWGLNTASVAKCVSLGKKLHLLCLSFPIQFLNKSVWHLRGKKKLLLLCEEELAESKLIAISRAKLQNSFQMIFFFCRKLSLMGGVNFRVLDTLSGALPLVTALRAPPAWSSSMLRMLNIVHFRLPLGKA